MVYSNRTWADTIFGRELSALEAKHPERVRVVHTLTRQESADGVAREVRQGRLTAPLLREVIGDPTACRVYLCGPAVSTWDRKAAREKGVEVTARASWRDRWPRSKRSACPRRTSRASRTARPGRYALHSPCMVVTSKAAFSPRSTKSVAVVSSRAHTLQVLGHRLLHVADVHPPEESGCRLARLLLAR